jgi:hypothetical protein
LIDEPHAEHWKPKCGHSSGAKIAAFDLDDSLADQ